MILNEMYDEILERLNTKYGINETTLPNNDATKKKFCLEIKEEYDRYIRKPYIMEEKQDEILFVVLKWHMDTKQFIDFYTKNNKIENIKSSSHGLISNDILNKLPCNGEGWFVERNPDNDRCIFILKNKKMYITQRKINSFTFNDVNDILRYEGVMIKKEDYFKYINE